MERQRIPILHNYFDDRPGLHTYLLTQTITYQTLMTDASPLKWKRIESIKLTTSKTVGVPFSGSDHLSKALRRYEICRIYYGL